MESLITRIAAVTVLLAVAAPLATAVPGKPGMPAEILSPEEGYGLVADLLSDLRRERRRAAARLMDAGDLSLVPGIVDALFFIPLVHRREALEALKGLTGADADSHRDWVELVGRRQEIEPKERYLEHKAALLSRIDSRYRQILYPGAPSTIRLEEVVWGGVGVDGIPPLEHPGHVPASEARYLADSEEVFGVYVGGEHRAFPVSVLSWHEMLNDQIGGEPVTLSYCTLCGSGILYAARTDTGEALTFGTSGLLYRSNKLMYDRQTWTLWSNLTGEPVIGRLVGSSAPLEVLPMTRTTWGTWKALYPETTVLAMDDELRRTGRRYGYRYRPGAADHARRGVSFPVWQKSDRLAERDEVYAMRIAGQAKAYTLEKLYQEGLVHDTLGGQRLLLVADPASGAVRAYQRGQRSFRRGDHPSILVDEAGGTWSLTEEALVHVDEGQGHVEPERLARLPGHTAFWFGWYAFFPDTEVWD